MHLLRWHSQHCASHDDWNGSKHNRSSYKGSNSCGRRDNNQTQQIIADIDWNITEKVAYKFVIFDAAGNPRTDDTVAIGETFDLAIIPRKRPISIKYQSSNGEELASG